MTASYSDFAGPHRPDPRKTSKYMPPCWAMRDSIRETVMAGASYGEMGRRKVLARAVLAALDGKPGSAEIPHIAPQLREALVKTALRIRKARDADDVEAEVAALRKFAKRMSGSVLTCACDGDTFAWTTRGAKSHETSFGDLIVELWVAAERAARQSIGLG